MVNNQFSLQNLRILCEVADYQSFAKTAQMMGVSPAFVTKRIQQLETDLGTRLFHRTTRQVSLTEQGEHVYSQAQHILLSVDGLQNQIDLMKGEPRGILRVSTSFGFGRRVVAQSLAQYSRNHPEVQIKLEVFDRLVDLARDKFDLDVRIGDIIDPNYIARKLASNHRILCASPEYLQTHGTPRKISELSEHNCLVIRERDHPVGIWKLSRRNKSINVKVDGSLTTNNGEIAVAWALAGHGIMLRSIWDSQEHLQSGQLVHILKEYRQEANVWAVYPERLSASAKIKSCVSHLEEYFHNWGKEGGQRPAF
ncbi:LysR substrate-binding domain-containing protein [Pusillimonas sp. ANT_WB101]|uniref:LysR substrate-binding domain-containing protein n=1 Tax=Pusillimonas sp. ANT_WB101 TaxID=2597356 RepID=UPI0011EC8147|nr:LysR substrate-binding domain-containing protein [Pusillimonas sp. ANT_WB101]KAA0889581.1 LysR family transcriptional regulator [Pusillimonas sp. ANT_WB101]